MGRREDQPLPGEYRPEFATRVREVRRDQGLTLEQLAKVAGVSKSYLSRLENGYVRRPAESVTGGISSALGVDKAELGFDPAFTPDSQLKTMVIEAIMGMEPVFKQWIRDVLKEPQIP